MEQHNQALFVKISLLLCLIIIVLAGGFMLGWKQAVKKASSAADNAVVLTPNDKTQIKTNYPLPQAPVMPNRVR